MENIVGRVKNSLRKAGVFVKNKLENFRENIQGMGTIEVVLIVAVLVALALLFKTFISKYADKLFNNIESKTEEAFQDW